MKRVRVRRLDAKAPGPRVLILGGVHGDETAAPRGLERLLRELSPGDLSRGSLLVAPTVNERALELGAHFVDENLNRCVLESTQPTSHERALAVELAEIIRSADIVLDLHGALARTEPFSFLDDESDAVIAWSCALGVKHLLRGWPRLYPGESGTTTEFAQRLGKPALTVELEPSDDPAGPESARRVALQTLGHFGMISGLHAPAMPRIMTLTGMTIKERSGRFSRPWANFDAVSAGEAIGRYDDGGVARSPEDAAIVMPYEDAAVGSEWFYLARPDADQSLTPANANARA